MKIPLLLLTLSLSATVALADVPATIAHQGRLVADGLNYTGTAYFKFQIYQSDAGAQEPAVAEALLTNGRVTSVRLLHGGKGYTAAPTVTLDAPGGLGTQAVVRANITAGTVTSFTITAAGSGYSAVPAVKISAPAGMSVMWSNSVDLVSPGRAPTDEPPSGVSLPVSGGLYHTALGNTGLTNMRPLATDLIPDAGKAAWLRVWVTTDSRTAYQELFPHQQVSPVAYARHAATAGSAESLRSTGPSTAGLLVTGGAVGDGAIPAEGEGARLMWFSAQRAFRAGYVESATVDPQGDGTSHGRWDEENVGRYSTAMGFNTVAAGLASTALGYNSTAAHSYATALGFGTRTGQSSQTVVGRWNTPSSSALFAVGNGSSDANRSNAFLVNENGDAIITGNATVTGNIVQTGNLSTGGNASLFGDLNIGGTADFGKNVYMNQALEVNGAFKVTASANITGNATIGGSAGVSGNISAQNLTLSQNFTAAGDGSVKTLTITGGADIAEPFDLGGENLEPGTVLIIDEEHTGRLRESSVAADPRVAGVVSGAGGIQPGLSLSQPGVNAGGHPVALAGRVYVKADATGAPIRAGDLLTTSATPGHAMRAPKDSHGAVLGKAMSSLREGRGLVLVLVSLQ